MFHNKDALKPPYRGLMQNHVLWAWILIFSELWEHWGQGGETVYSCAIITTSANPLMQTIHTRIHVILDPHYYRHWLNKLQVLLTNDAYAEMIAIHSGTVNLS